MKPHVHKWVETGQVKYTCPLEYEEKCSCGKIRWVEKGEIPHLTLTEEEMRKRYPKMFNKTLK
jgi:hypothetical protein